MRGLRLAFRVLCLTLWWAGFGLWLFVLVVLWWFVVCSGGLLGGFWALVCISLISCALRGWWFCLTCSWRFGGARACGGWVCGGFLFAGSDL